MDDHADRSDVRVITDRWERGEEPEFGRISFFTDAVFAIALTLLVLDIRVPLGLNDPDEPSTMLHQFNELAPKFVGFGVAFVLIGTYWMAHHSFVGTLRAFDRRLRAWNLVYLAFVAFFPFPASLVGEYPDNPISVVAFWVVLIVISGLETVMLVEAHHRDLMRVHLPPEVFRFAVAGSLQPVVIFLVLIPVAFWSPRVALFGPLFLLPIAGLIQSRYSPDDIERYYPRHRRRSVRGADAGD